VGPPVGRVIFARYRAQVFTLPELHSRQVVGAVPVSERREIGEVTGRDQSVVIFCAVAGELLQLA
jgi:hypothetical protein